MEFAKIADDIFRAELQRAGAAGMKPGGAAGDDLDDRRRHAERARSAKASALASKTSTGRTGADQCRPAAVCVWPCRAGSRPARDAADRSRRSRERFGRPRKARRRAGRDRHCAAPLRSSPAAGSAACRKDRRRSDWRAPAQARRRRIMRRRSLANERPGHRLDKAGGGQRAFGEPRALLQQGQNRLRDSVSSRAATASRRRDRAPAMRRISSTRSALPSMSGRQDGAFTSTRSAVACDAAKLEAELSRIAGHCGGVEFEPGQPLHFAPRKIDALVARAGVVRRETISEASPPQRSSTRCVASSSAGQAESRIDAALETIARIRVDAELRPVRAIFSGSQSADSISTSVVVFVAARGFAAHDAGERFDALVVGDDDDRLRRAHRCGHRARAGFSPGCARRTTRLPATFFASKTCSGRRAIEGQIIGDVDERIDRPQPDRASRFCIHCGRRPIAARRARAAARKPARDARPCGEIEPRPRPGQGKRPSTGATSALFKLAEAGGGEIAGDAVRCPRHRADSAAD